MTENDGGQHEVVNSSTAHTIAETALSLTTADAIAPFDEKEAVRDLLADADVVGMGEVTHGARPVMQFRHRLARFLVEDLGYRAFALEVNFSAARRLDQYITAGNGTANDALCRDGIHPFWQCESVVAFLEWARDFNDGREPTDQIRLYGLDTQYTKPAVEDLATYLETVAPDLHENVASELEYLNDPYMGVVPPEEGPQRFTEACHNLTTTLGPALRAAREECISRTSERDYERALQQVRQIEYRGTQIEAGTEGDSQRALELRDEAMADNVSWVLENESVDTMAIFAHNVHVNRSTLTDGTWAGVTPMGAVLADHPDLRYHAIGVSVGSGSFMYGRANRADPRSEGLYTFEEVTISEPPATSLPAILSETDSDLLALDVETLSNEGPVDEWLRTNPKRHDVLSDEADPVEYKQTDLRTEFDSLVFVKDPHPTRRLNC